MLIEYPATDKQKRLLEQSETGHFSMIRAMHLADLITLLNGTSPLQLQTQLLQSIANLSIFRLLRHQFYHVLSSLLPRQPQ